MPILSEFFGIIITMLWDDHAPPHFHAKHGEYEAIIEIHYLSVTGKFPKKALKYVLRWAQLHQEELIENWELAESHKLLKKIAALES